MSRLAETKMKYDRRTVGMIDVTDAPLDVLVRAAYAPSRQQGLGYLDTAGQSDTLTDEEVSAILERNKNSPIVALSMDYCRGRSVKFTVMKIGERLYIGNSWHDHSDDELRSLLQCVGLDPALLEQARAQRAEYDEFSLAAALAFLKDAGGSVEQNRWDDKAGTPIPDDVDAGFWVGRSRGLIKEDYQRNGITKWSLVDAKD